MRRRPPPSAARAQRRPRPAPPPAAAAQRRRSRAAARRRSSKRDVGIAIAEHAMVEPEHRLLPLAGRCRAERGEQSPEEPRDQDEQPDENADRRPDEAQDNGLNDNGDDVATAWRRDDAVEYGCLTWWHGNLLK